MEGFTKRDYLVAGFIIFGVVAIWFLLIATLMGMTDPGLGISITIVLSFIVYLVLKRKSKNSAKK
jgi:hypothetical protein